MDVGLTLDLRARLLDRIASDPEAVWTPSDFADLGSRAAVDKTLQRLVPSGEIRRIDRGLYDRPRWNSLTRRETVPDYRAVIRAVARRDQARVVVDGMTAANDLGLTTAVPAPHRGSHRCSPKIHQARQPTDPFQASRTQPPLLGWSARHAGLFKLYTGCRTCWSTTRSGCG